MNPNEIMMLIAGCIFVVVFGFIAYIAIDVRRDPTHKPNH